MEHTALWVYDTIDLGARVRHARQDKGLRQDELAERLGVTRMTISRLENGQPVSVDTALKALSECGYALVVAPKFTRVTIEDA